MSTDSIISHQMKEEFYKMYQNKFILNVPLHDIYIELQSKIGLFDKQLLIQFLQDEKISMNTFITASIHNQQIQEMNPIIHTKYSHIHTFSDIIQFLKTNECLDIEFIRHCETICNNSIQSNNQNIENQCNIMYKFQEELSKHNNQLHYMKSCLESLLSINK